MTDVRVGATLRAVRLRRGWRQSDVAAKASVSSSLVSLVERGHIEKLALRTLRQIAEVLEVQLDVNPRWRGADLDRLLNADHAALHESIAAFFVELPGWELAPEVTFSIFGERGVIDILAWHAATRTILIIELKTVLVDIHDLMSAADRRRRLATKIAAERGWDARVVASRVLLSNTRTNRRRVVAHQTELRTAFPGGGAEMIAWLRNPTGAISALSLWTNANGSGASRSKAGRQRVRVHAGAV